MNGFTKVALILMLALGAFAFLSSDNTAEAGCYGYGYSYYSPGYSYCAPAYYNYGYRCGYNYRNFRHCSPGIRQHMTLPTNYGQLGW